MGPRGFFNIEDGGSIDSVISRDQILLEPLHQFWEKAFEHFDTPIVMEDNTLVHKKVCIPVREDFRMQTLNWPPNSPDLNPIENIWSCMKDTIARDHATVSSTSEMKRIVKNMWDNFKDGEWDKLIESMPARMAAVIAAKGGSTKY